MTPIQYTVVDMQDMPREVKDACLEYFSGYINGGYYDPDIEGCPIDDEFVMNDVDSLIDDFGETEIYPVNYNSVRMNDRNYNHCILVIYLFKELNLSFDDVSAWDKILIKYRGDYF